MGSFSIKKYLLIFTPIVFFSHLANDNKFYFKVTKNYLEKIRVVPERIGAVDYVFAVYFWAGVYKIFLGLNISQSTMTSWSYNKYICKAITLKIMKQ